MFKFLIAFFIFFFYAKADYNKTAIVPAYFYNIDKWNEIAKYQNEIVIINPSNGPGSVIDKHYQDFIAKLNANKNLPIGYIYTKWGKRDIEKVKNDIDKWIELYQIKGFFVDEVSIYQTDFNYYKQLTDYIKSKGKYYIVLNPGTYPDEEYFNIADNIIVFENNISKLKGDECNKNSQKSSIIAYDANESQMKNVIMNYKCKSFYLTDGKFPNPYSDLSTYFDKEIELITQFNQDNFVNTDIKLYKGWNLVGITQDINANVLSYQTNATIIWKYDAENKKWAFYSSNSELKYDKNLIKKLTVLKKGDGCWLYIEKTNN